MPIVDGHLVIDGHVYGGGDGTTKDQAIEITTFKELMDADNETAVGTRVYLKIVEDLYPSQEDWFTGYITKYQWKSYIYCDDDARKKIDGMIVNNLGFLAGGQTSNTYQAYFYNIDFTNCVWYPSSNGSNFFLGSSVGSQRVLTVDSCTLSIRLGGPTTTSVYDITAYNAFLRMSSLYILGGSGRNSIPSMLNQGSYYLSNIVLESLTITSMNPTYMTYYQQSSFIFKNCTIVGNLGTNGIGYNILSQNHISGWSPTQTYFAFLNCTYTYSLYNVAIGTVCVIASDTTPYPFQKDTDNYPNTQVILATCVDSDDPDFNTSSIKSKQFLIDSGFLP